MATPVSAHSLDRNRSTHTTAPRPGSDDTSPLERSGFADITVKQAGEAYAASGTQTFHIYPIELIDR
jgi:hypothetical protein